MYVYIYIHMLGFIESINKTSTAVHKKPGHIGHLRACLNTWHIATSNSQQHGLHDWSIGHWNWPALSLGTPTKRYSFTVPYIYTVTNLIIVYIYILNIYTVTNLIWYLDIFGCIWNWPQKFSGLESHCLWLTRECHIPKLWNPNRDNYDNPRDIGGYPFAHPYQKRAAKNRNPPKFVLTRQKHGRLNLARSKCQVA